MLGPIQIYRALRAVVRVTLDPNQLDEVFVLADMAEESGKMEEILEGFRESPRLQRILEERPRIGALDQDALLRLPEGTLGRTYAEFMKARGLVHEDLVLVEGESESVFLRNHLRESHDIWHVATGFDTNVAGELGLQAFYLAQFDGPLAALLLGIGLLNTFMRSMDDVRPRMDQIARGWLLGKRAQPLFGTRWSDHFERPLAEFRREHDLDLAAVDEVIAARGAEGALARAA